MKPVGNDGVAVARGQLFKDFKLPLRKITVCRIADVDQRRFIRINTFACHRAFHQVQYAFLLPVLVPEGIHPDFSCTLQP